MKFKVYFVAFVANFAVAQKFIQQVMTPDSCPIHREDPHLGLQTLTSRTSLTPVILRTPHPHLEHSHHSPLHHPRNNYQHVKLGVSVVFTSF